MDPMVRWAMRIAMWFRRPPSRQQALLMASVVGACLLIVALERWLGWPAWLTLGNSPSVVRR